MEGLHITIKDNVTGEIMFDTDAKAIVGGVATEDGVSCISYSRCDGMEYCFAIAGAKIICANEERDDDKIRRGVKLIERVERKKAKERKKEKGGRE